ncbi:MAG TPA: hypothetical protein VJ695_09465 [Nitrososphaera sp.]|nr:hypothetical protein [Nitrososphaera sp.]
MPNSNPYYKKSRTGLEKLKTQRILLKAMNMLGLFVVVSLASTTISPLNTIGHSYALQQIAGNIIIETMPGDTETFSWG